MANEAVTAPTDRLLRWPLALGSVVIVGATVAAGLGALPSSISAASLWMLIMVAIACGICAAGIGTAWRGAALMGAGLWLGLSAQLALTQPLWYQFIRLRPDSAYDAGLWGLIGLQGLVAATLLATTVRLSAPIRVVRDLGPVRVGLVLALLAILAIGAGQHVATHSYAALLKQWAAGVLLLAINLASAAALGASLPSGPLRGAVDRVAAALSLPGQPDATRPLDRWLPWAAAAWTLLASAAVALLAFGGAPHVPDEIAYLFQARYMANGAIGAPLPPEAVRAAVAYDFLVERGGRWFAVTPPGWPAVLAIGVRLGAPWLVNPALGALAVLMAHQVTDRLVSRGMANLVAVLMAVSPWLVGTSASLMTHALALALALTAVRLLLAAREGRIWPAFAAGAAMGLVFLTRPVDGMITGVLAGLWTLTFLRRPGGWRTVIAYGLGCVAIGALIFPYNASLMGDPLSIPLQVYQDELWGVGSNRMGFGPDIGPPNLWLGGDLYRGHSPFEATLLTQLAGYATNFELFGWPGASLALAFGWLVWGRRTRFGLAMSAVVAVVVVVFFFYWYNATFYIGPRYWSLMLPALVALSAAGAEALGGRLSRAGVTDASPRVGAVLAGLCLFSALAFLPWRTITRYHDHRDFHAGYQSAARNLHGGLVFVTAKENDLASALAMNSPFLEPTRPIFLRDLGPASRAAAMRAFPGRPVYFTQGRKDGAPPIITNVAP